MGQWDIQYQQLKIEVESLIDQLRNLDGDGRLENEYRRVFDFDSDQLENKIVSFLNENRKDGSHARASATLKSIRNAIKCLEYAVTRREEISQSLIHRALNLLVSCQHPFKATSSSAAKFNKDFELFERQRELRTEDMKQNGSIYLSDNYQMKEVHSVLRLMDIGKALHNCAADYEEARARINRVLSGEVKLYAVEKCDVPIYLLQFETDVREIVDFSARRHHHENWVRHNEVLIPYGLAMEILTTLDISGDDIPEFICVGAFSKFKNGRPKTTPFVINGMEIWKWRFQDELIIAVDENSDGKLYWSRFKLPFKNRGWNSRRRRLSHELSVRDLFDLVFQNPDLLEHLREPAIDCCTSPRRLRNGTGAKALLDF